MAMNGKEIKTMHLQIEWSNAASSRDRFTWEPLTTINRDVPQMVSNYFNFANINLQKILNDEADRRGNNQYSRRNIFNKGQGSK